VVLSDDAGQFDIGRHAPCWVHAERLVHKLDTFTDLQRAAQQRVRKLRRLTALLGISPLRGLIWNFYADLKIDRANPAKAAVWCCAPGSIASSAVAPASPRWIDC
jgi:hypothetical protein